MGVDYNGVGGIGIKVTDDIICELIENGTFIEEDWDDDPDECLNDIGLAYASAGNCYSGDTYYYWFVSGKNLDEINANANGFIKKLDDLGIRVTTKDLMVIEDLHVY